MTNFKEITPGLIDNPFLNIFINPSRITEIKDRFNFYADFRAERIKEEQKFVDYPMPHLRPDFYFPIYVRLPIYSTSKAQIEPEPKFSIGFITAPLKSIANKFFIGATYQIIHKVESFYSVPSWIYYPSIDYDLLGNRLAEVDYYPSYDIFGEQDEMITSANLFSVFSGYKLIDNFSIGLQINRIDHFKDGIYRKTYNENSGNINNTIYYSNYFINRNRNYKQTDFAFGVTYSKSLLKLGAKLGVLNGKADQSLKSTNSHFFQQNQPDLSPTWNIDYNDYKITQNWNNSGNVYYGGIDFFYNLTEDIHLTGYFNYAKGDINFQNSSIIKDTSYYYSKYDYLMDNQNYWNKSKSSYSLIDNRTGDGVKKKSDYSGLIVLRWKVSSNVKLIFGLAYFEKNFDIKSREPVINEIVSMYTFNTNNLNYQNRNSYIQVFEDKVLEWNYSSVEFSYQIPVVFDFVLSEKFVISVLVNQIYGGIKTKEYTEAFINQRVRTENDSTKQMSNIIEKYTYPTIRYTFDKTDLIGKFKFNLHPNFKICFLINPELTPSINVAQVWFSIEARF